MTSPLSTRVSERATIENRLVAPTARIFAATIILLSGAGMAAIFWKMPQNAELYDLCHAGIIDKDLATVPLPDESIVSISSDELLQMPLPVLDIAPVRDSGVEKYAQIYAAPASLAVFNAEQGKIDPSSAEEESVFVPVVSHKFEPMRQIVEKKPISVEPVNRDFQQKPASINTIEKSDELHTMFRFAENSKEDIGNSATVQPADPFPVMDVSTSTLQPLMPIEYDRQLSPLSPLLPLPVF